MNDDRRLAKWLMLARAAGAMIGALVIVAALLLVRWLA